MTALPSPRDPDCLRDAPENGTQAFLDKLGLPSQSPGGKLVRLAVLAVRQGLWAQAIAALRNACAFHPENVGLLMELGQLLQLRRQDRPALEIFNQVVQLDPHQTRVYPYLGALLISTGKTALAIQASRIGLALDPDMAGLYINLASALRAEGQLDEAWDTYKALLARHPHHAAGLTDALHLRQHLNDWDGYAAHRKLVLDRSYRLDHRVPPFTILAACDSPEDHKLAGRAWVKRICEQSAGPLAAYGPRPEPARARPIRVGYLSNDFYNHATALLIVGLLELRDRSRFEAIGYAIGNVDDGTTTRHRIISAFDLCYDISALDHEAAAQKIQADGIDILIDLKGFTSGSRPEIMALHPAPIQVNYLGYPGTMGAPFIDYIIADPVVIPSGCEADFDEKVVRLPECYQPNDSRRPVWPEPYSRADCGLPDDAFVFCSFNAPYKITPEMYDIWMRILHRVPGSVLWLMEGHATSAVNLSREAAARGIAPDRIVIAPKMVTEKHLARIRLGDLFLDSFPVTAHTTASDALWVGLPVLTCPGASFVSRVAASLLHAIGTPDTIAADFADYEEKAVRLATDPAALASIRARIEANRFTAPLFDSARYTRHYEDALQAMVARMDAGLPVAGFDVPARPA